MSRAPTFLSVCDHGSHMPNNILDMLAPVLPFAMSYFLLAIIPGPNLLVVADAGARSDRTSAICAAFGVATGACCLSAVMSAGSVVIVGGSALREVLALLFGSYLMSLAFRSWGRAWAVRRLPDLRVAAPTRSSFRLAFLTAVANPTTAIFILSATPIAPKNHTGWIITALTVFAIASFWFGLVGLVASSSRLKLFQLRLSGLLDFAFGTAFSMLGITTLLSAL